MSNIYALRACVKNEQLLAHWICPAHLMTLHKWPYKDIHWRSIGISASDKIPTTTTSIRAYWINGNAHYDTGTHSLVFLGFELLALQIRQFFKN